MIQWIINLRSQNNTADYLKKKKKPKEIDPRKIDPRWVISSVPQVHMSCIKLKVVLTIYFGL